MTKSGLIAAVIAAGFLVVLPVLVWGLADVAKIPGGVWRHAAERPRHQWRVGMLSAYALGGWPAIFAVLAWLRSRERTDLRLEWADLSVRKRRSRERAAGLRAGLEPAIVPADPEESTSSRVGRADA
jgi:hypothetical protein